MTTSDRETQDPVAIFANIRPTGRYVKMTFLRYALGIGIEIAVAFWLLSVARGEFAWAAWLAYLILASALLATLVALSWCWLWFVERGFGWFLAAIVSLLGTALVLNWDIIVDWLRHAP